MSETSGEFLNLTALVTGGSRGIGRAVALALARDGANVAVNFAHDEEAASGTREEITASGGKSEIYRADVADPHEVREMVKAVESDLGPVDLLVTSAGIARVGPSGEFDLEDWRAMMRVNVDGTCLPVMAVRERMLERGYGRIVCLASIAGLRPRPNMIGYSTSKAAVIGFVRSAAAALGPAVRVNGVAPGLVHTDMTAGMDPETLERMREEAILRRHGQPDDIASVVTFLLSDRSGFMTGQTLVADGGRVLVP